MEISSKNRSSEVLGARAADKKIYNEPWYLYIAECRDKTLYVGIARDVDKRIKEHNTTSKCRYTRYRKPITVKYKELCDNYSVARKREAEVKKFSRKKKLDLIRGKSHPFSE